MLDNNDPVYLKGFALECVEPTRLAKFTPKSIHLLESYESHRDTGTCGIMSCISVSRVDG